MSSRCPCSGTTHDNAKKKKSQWEGPMKEFCEKRKEKCKGAIAAPSRQVMKEFPTGSSFEGAYEDMNMRGYGEYTFPNGVVYRGDFENGMCDGTGELIYYNNPEDFTVIRGKWVKGILTDRQILFNGILEYDEGDWRYCKMPDRRYSMEFNKELKPGGQSNITAEQPPREIPPGFRDNGYGFYNPETKVVYRYQNILEVAKAVSNREQNWISKNCRMEPVVKIGPRPDFYEAWLEPDPDPPPLPQLLVGFTPLDTLSLFQPDADAEDRPVFYDAADWTFEGPSRKFQPAPK